MKLKVAVERMMRLLQAIGLILTSYTGLIALLQPSSSAAMHISTRLTLVSLQDFFNVTRRSIRTLWFLRSFQSSYKQYISSQPKGVEDWLDVLAGSVLGIFGLLETVTLPDMMSITGIAIFGPRQSKELNVQAQVFWFLGLLAMVLSAGVKIFRLFAERALPLGADFGAEKEEAEDEKTNGGGNKAGQANKLAKQCAAEKKRKQHKDDVAKATQAQISALGLKIVNDMLDMVIPANVCGWTNVHPGQVGIAMMITSLITLRGHWDRCGQALQ